MIIKCTIRQLYYANKMRTSQSPSRDDKEREGVGGENLDFLLQSIAAFTLQPKMIDFFHIPVFGQ